MLLPPLPPNFDAALRDSGARDGKWRLAAAHRLAAPPEGREGDACRGLVRLANDELGPIRAAALRSLESLGDPRGLAVAKRRMDDEHDAVRQAALRAAAAIDDDALEWLPAMAQDPRPEMRAQAVLAVAELAGGEQALPVLREALADEDSRVRGAAAIAVGELGLGDLDDTLAGMLDDAPEVAFAAAAALAELGDERGEPVLIAALRDRDAGLDAAEALGEIATEAGLEALAYTAQRTFAPLLLKAAAGAALAKRGDARGEPALGRVLSAWRADGRDYAVHAVGELGLEGLVPALVGLAERLRGADPRVLADALERFAEQREDAGRALGLLRERHAVA